MPGGATIALLGVAGYLVAINLAAFLAMALDKARAGRGRRRISEATLLRLAMLGGGLGTAVAQRAIRHKTRKEPFRSRLRTILVLQLAALAAAALLLALVGAPATP